MRVRIETGSESKGRSFEFEVLGYAACDRLQPSSSNMHRPFFMVLAMSDAVVAPVRANILTGRPFGQVDQGSLKRKGEWFEFLKSHRWAWEPQKVAEGTLVTIYRPDLIMPDPGFVDPQLISFGVLIDHDWVAASEAHAPVSPETQAQLKKLHKWLEKLPGLDVVEFTQHVPLICAYLDRRTRVPLVQDRLFQVMLCGKLVEHRVLKPVSSTQSYLKRIRMAEAYTMLCQQSAFEALAADVLQKYYGIVS